MFTFKKFAIVSVAALTIISLSACGEDDPEPGEVIDLVKKDFILSLSGKSYGDIDGNKTYSQSEATTNAGKIDVVAYYTSGAADEVVNPCYVPATSDGCGYPELYTIPAKYWEQLANGKNTADIAGFLDAFAADEIDNDEVDEISIVKNSAFFVWTTEVRPFVVVIKDKGTQTVNLSFSSTGLE